MRVQKRFWYGLYFAEVDVPCGRGMTLRISLTLEEFATYQAAKGEVG